MGSNNSALVQEVETEIQTIARASIESNISSEQATSITNRQKNIIRVNGNMVIGKGATFSRKQSMLTKAQIFMSNDSAITADISNTLTNKINDILNATAEQQNEGIPIGQVNVTDTSTITKKDIHSHIDNSIATTVSSLTDSDSINSQKLGLDIDGSFIISAGASFEDLQESSMDVVSDVLAKNIVNSLQKAIVTNETTAKLTTKAIQKNKGIDAFMLFGIALIIALCGGIYYMVKNNGQLPRPSRTTPEAATAPRAATPPSAEVTATPAALVAVEKAVEKASEKAAEKAVKKAVEKVVVSGGKLSEYMYYGGESSSTIPIMTIVGLLFAIANK